MNISLQRFVEGRIPHSPQDLLKRLHAAYCDGEIRCAAADLVKPCRVARALAPEWANHPTVLAISVGGSNSAAMLASNEAGYLQVEEAVRIPNPARPEAWPDFLDRLVLGSPAMAAYLRDAPTPVIGVSVAVPFIDGIPEHPSKIDTITGLVCRDAVRDGADYHFPTNFNKWLKSRGLKEALIVCEGDAPVAHLGGVAAGDLSADDPTLLLVCGTGLACADDRQFILPSMYPLLRKLDSDLFPDSITENGQYQYLCAGKGIYRILKRALELRAVEQGSSLADAPEIDWLERPVHSRRVYDLWSNYRNGVHLTDELAAIRENYSPAAWDEILRLAVLVGDQAVGAMAAAVVGSLQLHPEYAGRTVKVFCEGSIARDAKVFGALSAMTTELLDSHRPWGHNAAAARIEWQLQPARPPAGLPSALAAVDQTLHGAAAMAMAARVP